MKKKETHPDGSLDSMLPFLKDPSFYPHQPRKVCIIQTHCSLVVVAKPFVYKFKKAVDFGFLNYSTLPLRQQFLEREFELNQRLAPGVYIEVRPLFWNAGKLAWEGTRLAEWVLVMRYLPHYRFLDQLILRGHIDRPEIQRMLDLLVDFYEQPESQSSQKGTLSYLRTAIRTNFRLTESFIDVLIPKPVHASLKRAASEGFRRLRNVFQDRMRDRWRYCHGDLHLDHVHLTPKQIRIYDCIEFNDGLRWIDIANDLAFLAMDLDEHGRSDLARYLMESAAIKMKDSSMCLVRDFYKTYRAMVRAKVESLQVYPNGFTGTIDSFKKQRAEAYYRLALDYAVTGRQPVVLVVMGEIGTGKSTVAKHLAAWLKIPHLNSDILRKEMAGVPLHERPDADTRKQVYSEEMNQRVYQDLLHHAIQHLQKDQSVVVDATFSKQNLRALWWKHLKQRGMVVRWIELTASPTVIRKRLTERARENQVISDAGVQEWEQLRTQYQRPDELDASTCIQVTSSQSVHRTMKRVLDGLVDKQMDAILQHIDQVEKR